MTDAVKSQRPPGRPSTGAKERILDAGLETLLEEGYAGLTYTKVAERAGENKSLISYYFDSKQGLVGRSQNLSESESRDRSWKRSARRNRSLSWPQV